MRIGLYFMGWYRDMWNYHPSLPMRNMQMIEDIQDMGANTLIWSCLGSGAIGLPYLDREANDATPPRMRLYGFMNDSEFCAECAKRDITVFSVLWKGQLWEFPAELNEDESELLSLNILRGASANKKFVGMSELSTNRYPKLFNPIESYFPDGLLDYKGRKVGDFLQEFKSISLEGRSILLAWLMAPGHEHKCYTPCSNKQSYLSYMKRNVEIMSDAGAGGLHIDEYDTQRHVLQNAGCFCAECVDKFRDYLRDNNIPLPKDAGELSSFDYRCYLLGKGYKDADLVAGRGKTRWQIPLYRHFTDMQMDSIEWVVGELSRHVKAYSQKTRGSVLPVTANLFQCFPYSWKCKKHLDILAGEKTKIQLRQDHWYKFSFGWLNGKDSCFVEDPNQYVRDMLVDIKNNIQDRFILFALEPMAQGFHVAFPYGSWLQNQVKDAFWPDLRVLRELGTWLQQNERLFPRNPVAEIAVVYDAVSALENLLSEGGEPSAQVISFEPNEELGQQGAFNSDGSFDAFFDLTEKMSKRNIQYNVLYESPDEPLTRNRLQSYRKVVVPDAFLLSNEACDALSHCDESVMEVITFARAAKCMEASRNFRLDQIDNLVDYLSQEKGLIYADGCGQFGFTIHKGNEGNLMLHIVNYNYNEDTHHIDLVNATFHLGFIYKEVKQHSFPANPQVTCRVQNNVLELQHIGIYTIVEFSGVQEFCD